MRKAFTLVELLVVIAVIAVLAAIALPVLSKSRKSAHRTHCLSNLRQLGVAIHTYCDDYDDKYPWAWADNYVYLYPTVCTPSLRQAVTPYAREGSLWACPTDTGETWPLMVGGFKKRTPPLYTFYYDSSYGWLGLGRDAYLPGRSRSRVKRPASVLLLVECRPWHGSPKPNDNYYTTTDMFNTLYCDGHAVAQPYLQIQIDRQRAR